MRPLLYLLAWSLGVVLVSLYLNLCVQAWLDGCPGIPGPCTLWEALQVWGWWP